MGLLEKENQLPVSSVVGVFSSLAHEPGKPWGLSFRLCAHGLELSIWSVDDAMCSLGRMEYSVSF